MSVSLSSRHMSSPSVPASQATSKYDHVIKSRSCHQASNMQHLYQDQCDFHSLSDSIISIICGLETSSIDRPGYIAWYLPRNFARSKVLCLHQIMRIQSKME